MPDSSFPELDAPFQPNADIPDPPPGGAALAVVGDRVRTSARLDSAIDEQGWQSFPASDPPSTWWGGSGDSTR